jgi:prephenate dehydrogenase
LNKPFQPLNKLVIFGVGLIGGSLALALKRVMPQLHVTGMGRSGDSLQTASDLGIIDSIGTDIPFALADADIVVIAAPVAQTLPILQAIAPHLGSRTIVTDVGSTKSDVIRAAEQALGANLPRFVPAHPIAGAEQSGAAAARAELFQDKNLVLTPTADTDPEAVQQVRRMWEAAGARVQEMTAAQHDSIFAAVSHLPHLLAFALVDELASRPNAGQLFDFAASGFRDFTRIAGSSPEMWRDISLANREALLDELQAYQQALTDLMRLLQDNDGAGLQALFERASQARNNWARAREIKK